MIDETNDEDIVGTTGSEVVPTTRHHWSTLVVCPHCSTNISLNIDLMSREAIFSRQVPPKPRSRAERFSTGQVALLEKLDELGLMEPFSNAVRASRMGQMPKDLDRFFLGWLRRASACVTPQESLKILVAEYPNTFVKVWASEGIVMVTSDRMPVLFVPEVYVQTSRHKRGMGHNPLQLGTLERELREWIRTRNGYVSSRGYLWEELQKRSKGAFAIPDL